MNLFKGLSYNMKGLGMSLRTPKLLLLGLIRIVVVLLLTIVAAGLIFYYYQQIVDLIWSKPESNQLTKQTCMRTIRLPSCCWLLVFYCY